MGQVLDSKKKKENPAFVTNHMSAGGTRGILTFGPLIFLEGVTRLPLSTLFNMQSGSSAGAAIAGIMNIPKSRESSEPRYSAIDGEEGYKQILQYAMPKRKGRMALRLCGKIIRDVHELRKKLTATICKELDENLTIAANFIGRKKHELLNSASPYAFKEVNPFGRLNDNIIKHFDDVVEEIIDWVFSKARHDMNVLYRSVDTAFRYEDSNEPVTLGDTLISHHATSINLTRNKPGLFYHLKDKDGKSSYVSDPGVYLSDVTAASCAAPIVFDSHVINYMENGGIVSEHYADVGHYDNARTPLDTLQGHDEGDPKYRFIIMGTGKDEQEFNVKMLESPVYQMWDVPQIFMEKINMKGMRQNIGDENVIEIDLPINWKTFSTPYNRRGSEKLMRAARLLGFDLNERDRIDPWKKMPSSGTAAKFDTSPEAIEKLSEAKWDMVWHNIDTLATQAKWLVNNAAAQGRITEEFAKQAVSNINWLYPPEGHDSSEYPEPETPFPNLRKAQPSIVIEVPPQPKGLYQSLAAMFREKSAPIMTIRKRTANDNSNAEPVSDNRNSGASPS